MDLARSRDLPQRLAAARLDDGAVGRRIGGAPARPTDDPLRIAQAFRALAAVTWLLLVFGATVRVNGAGLSCPDWPLCFGRVIPELNVQVFLEWGHRVLAGTISTVFVGLGGWVYCRPELWSRVAGLVAASLVLLIAQIGLGGLTVLQLLAYWSVTLHLLTGNLFLLSLLAIASRLDPRPVASSARTRTFATAVVGMWFFQMALGGLVSSNHAGLACTQWPTCNGGVWFPAFDGIVGLQILHRAGAYTLVGLALGFAWSARREGARGLGLLVLGLVLGQVALGVTNVLLAMPVEVAVLHSAMGDVIGIVAAGAGFRLWAGVAGSRFAPLGAA